MIGSCGSAYPRNSAACMFFFFLILNYFFSPVFTRCIFEVDVSHCRIRAVWFNNKHECRQLQWFWLATAISPLILFRLANNVSDANFFVKLEADMPSNTISIVIKYLNNRNRIPKWHYKSYLFPALASLIKRLSGSNLVRNYNCSSVFISNIYFDFTHSSVLNIWNNWWCNF